MRHVAPERWAALVAGRLPAGERSALEAHAATCPRCARERVRVESASSSLRMLRVADPPPLSWDRVGAQLWWSASTEMRRRGRPRRRTLWPFALAGVTVGAAAVVLVATSVSSPTRAPSPVVSAPAPAVSPGPPAQVAPEPPTPLEGVVTFLQGEVHAGAEPVTADTPVRAGQTIVTTRGRLAAQFAERAGFVLEAGATLEIVSFDAREVVLRIASGAITVELAPGSSAPARFTVLAAGRAVEVRGTVFRVAEHEGDVDVAVGRGKVAVRDALHDDGAVEVPAGARLALARGVALRSAVPEIVAEELAPAMRFPMVPGFESAAKLREQAPMLAVHAPARTAVRVDGLAAGTGSFQVRRSPGRHLVEAGSISRWIDVEAGTPVETTLSERTRSERPGQLDARLRQHQRAVARCVEAAHKTAPGSGELEIEVGIRADGSVDFVAPAGASRGDGTKQSMVDCVLGVVRNRFTFPPGTPATIRKVIRF